MLNYNWTVTLTQHVNTYPRLEKKQKINVNYVPRCVKKNVGALSTYFMPVWQF